MPWSERGERLLRSHIDSLWRSMWMFIIAGVTAFAIAIALRNAVPAVAGGFCLATAVWSLLVLQKERTILGEEMRRLPNGEFFEGSGMLANKPRSNAKLTEWTQWRPDSTSFLCTCRRLHQWPEAEWIPNLQVEDTVIGTQVEIGDALGAFIDPHGGRYVILCPCGLGHYKLKA